MYTLFYRDTLGSSSGLEERNTYIAFLKKSRKKRRKLDQDNHKTDLGDFNKQTLNYDLAMADMYSIHG